MPTTYDERLADNLRLLRNRLHGDLIDGAKWLSSTLTVANAAALVIAFGAVIDGQITDVGLVAWSAWAFAVGAAFAFAAAIRSYFLGQHALALLTVRVDATTIVLDSSVSNDQRNAATVRDQKSILGLKKIAKKAGSVAVMYLASGVCLIVGVLRPLLELEALMYS